MREKRALPWCTHAKFTVVLTVTAISTPIARSGNYTFAPLHLSLPLVAVLHYQHAKNSAPNQWSVSSRSTIWREIWRQFDPKNCCTTSVVWSSNLLLFKFSIFFRWEGGRRRGEMGFISGVVMGMIIGVALIAGWSRAMARRAAKRSAKANPQPHDRSHKFIACDARLDFESSVIESFCFWRVCICCSWHLLRLMHEWQC